MMLVSCYIRWFQLETPWSFWLRTISGIVNERTVGRWWLGFDGFKSEVKELSPPLTYPVKLRPAAPTFVFVK